MTGHPEELEESLTQSFDEVLKLAKAVSHRSRLRILVSLLAEPRAFQDIKRDVKLEKSALANHLTKLTEASLVQRYQHGVYRITPDGRALLEALDRVMGDFQIRSKRERESKMRRQIVKSFLRRTPNG